MSGQHERVIRGLADIINNQEWGRLADYFHNDAVFEYPQSGERFRGIVNIRAQFENYPALEPGSNELQEVVEETTAYALTPTYTLIAVEGTGDRGTAVIRVRYPDASIWYAINLYELREDRLIRSRTYFAPEFDAPEWRAPYREVS